MTEKEQELLSLLGTRVRELVQQDKSLREQIHALEGQIAEQNEKIKEIGRQREEVAAQYANLKVARMLELSDSDTREARQRLSRLVRDVDKCIALLKA